MVDRDWCLWCSILVRLLCFFSSFCICCEIDLVCVFSWLMVRSWLCRFCDLLFSCVCSLVLWFRKFVVVVFCECCVCYSEMVSISKVNVSSLVISCRLFVFVSYIWIFWLRFCCIRLFFDLWVF